jgi:hypothetical protein
MIWRHLASLIAFGITFFACGQEVSWGIESHSERDPEECRLAQVVLVFNEASQPEVLQSAEQKTGAPEGSGKPAPLGSSEMNAQEEFSGWVLSRADSPSLRKQVESLLDKAGDGDPVERLQHWVQLFALVDPRGTEIAAWKIVGGIPGLAYKNERRGEESHKLEDSWVTSAHGKNLVTDPGLPNSVRATVATWLALGLVQVGLFDEAKELLYIFPPEASPTPEVVYYSRAITEYQLGNGKEAREASQWLLDRAGVIPARYQLVARMIVAETSKWESSPLRQASQWMGDVARRLEFGRNDAQLVPLQDRILETLDRLIEEASRKQKKAQVASQGSTRSVSPAEESLPLAGKGAGEAPRRPLGGPAKWGDLPPKDREEALQMIYREFPPHYRQAIEQYFRRLAEDSENKPRANPQVP